MGSNALELHVGKPRHLNYSAELREDYKLLELDEATLSEVLELGVVLKGQPDEELVMCTCNKTYALKHVETSNALLLVPPRKGDEYATQYVSQTEGDENRDSNIGRGLLTQKQENSTADARFPITITAAAGAHIEVVEIAPRLQLLPALLAERPYGLADEDCSQPQDSSGAGAAEAMEVDGGSGPAGPCGRMYTFDELLGRVQASSEELRAALRSLGALELHGCWRLVEPKYLGDLLEMVVVSAAEFGWPLDAIPEADLVEALQQTGYQAAVIKHCLDLHGSMAEPAAGPGSSSSTNTWSLDRHKVCLHYARKLLQAKPEGWSLQRFMDAWQQEAPAELSPSPDMLRGEVLLEAQAGSSARAGDRGLKHFPASGLPGEPSQRFAALFRERARWEASDLEPYLAGVTRAPGQSAEAVLLKYARISQATPDAPVYYTSRY